MERFWSRGSRLPSIWKWVLSWELAIMPAYKNIAWNNISFLRVTTLPPWAVKVKYKYRFHSTLVSYVRRSMGNSVESVPDEFARLLIIADDIVEIGANRICDRIFISASSIRSVNFRGIVSSAIIIIDPLPWNILTPDDKGLEFRSLILPHYSKWLFRLVQLSFRSV